MHKECLSKMFFHKIHTVLENKQEFNFPEDNFKKLKELKINTKKSLIKSMAEIDLIMVDIKAKLWDKSPDIGEIGKLLDKKYSLKRDAMKTLIEAFISFKKMLSEEDFTRLHEIMRTQRGMEEKSCCK